MPISLNASMGPQSYMNRPMGGGQGYMNRPAAGGAGFLNAPKAPQPISYNPLWPKAPRANPTPRAPRPGEPTLAPPPKNRPAPPPKPEEPKLKSIMVPGYHGDPPVVPMYRKDMGEYQRHMDSLMAQYGPQVLRGLYG